MMTPPRLCQLVVIASMVSWAASTSRADFQYDFTLKGTITQVSDLATIVSSGQSIHLLPDMHVGDPVVVTGSLFIDPTTGLNATFYALFASPLGIQHIGPTTNGGIYDPANLSLGFYLNGGGFLSTHPAVIPHRVGSDYDMINAFRITGDTMSVTYTHDSLQLSNLTATVLSDFSSIVLTAVPEPPSATLLMMSLLVTTIVAGPRWARRWV